MDRIAANAGRGSYATTSSHETRSLRIRTWWGYSYAVELDVDGRTLAAIDRRTDGAAPDSVGTETLRRGHQRRAVSRSASAFAE